MSDQSTEKVWVAVDIGCIECGESTRVLGIFQTEDDGWAAVRPAEEKQQENWSGQHSFELFEIDLPDWLVHR